MSLINAFTTGATYATWSVTAICSRIALYSANSIRVIPSDFLKYVELSLPGFHSKESVMAVASCEGVWW